MTVRLPAGVVEETAMVYFTLTEEDRRQLQMERLRALEVAHFEQVILLKEASAAGDDAAARQASDLAATIAQRIEWTFNQLGLSTQE